MHVFRYITREVVERWYRGKQTHCPNLPPCVMVIRILSAKYRQVTLVSMPFTFAEAVWERAGKGDGRISEMGGKFGGVMSVVMMVVNTV